MGGWFMSPKAADSANGSCPKEEDCPDNDDTLFKTPLLRYCRGGRQNLAERRWDAGVRDLSSIQYASE